MRHAPLALCLAIAGALAAAGAAPAVAQVNNGTFDAGLAGWTATTTGGGGVAVVSNGNPAPGVRLWNQFDNAGSATLTQTFECGGGSEGMCFLSLDYATDVTGGVTNMAVTVKLDNVVMYSTIHNSTVMTYTPVLFSAPCGQHTLEISAGSSATQPWANWMMIVDNVTASCVPPVSAERSTWSGLKATYR